MKKKTKCYIYTRVSTAIHEAIISEEDWDLAQEKRSKNNYKLSVLNASLHQAETIKTRLEQQMDNLDVTDTHYDKKISDLQRRMNIWFLWKSYQHLRAWFYFAGKWTIIVFQFAVKWCRIKTTFQIY